MNRELTQRRNGRNDEGRSLRGYIVEAGKWRTRAQTAQSESARSASITLEGNGLSLPTFKRRRAEPMKMRCDRSLAGSAPITFQKSRQRETVALQ